MPLSLRQLGALLALWAAACAGDDSGSSGRDAGADAGLSDIPPDAEQLRVTPTSVHFADVAVGQTDLQTLTLTNGSTADLDLTQIAIVDSAEPVRFVTPFLRDAAEAAGWADLDGNGQDFEVRDQPIVLAAGASLEVVLQFRPDGTLLDCPDRAPSACGFLLFAGQVQTVSVPVFVPR